MKKTSSRRKTSRKTSRPRGCPPCASPNNNASFNITVGSKAQVWHGTAKHTSGGLHRKHLMQTDGGRIISKKAHAHGKRMFRKNESVMRMNQAPPFA